jgi:sugar/nucleoside kinase (ribokinase family)
MPTSDYLVIGHISLDLTRQGQKTGGTVAYSGRTAHCLGCRTSVLTSAAAGIDWPQTLPGIEIHSVPSEKTTVFENLYTAGIRRQVIHSLAGKIGPEHIPKRLLQTPIVHFAPIADEIDPEMMLLFPEALLCITPQGWMRGWDSQGNVYPSAWPKAEKYFPLASAVILSEEDLPDGQLLKDYSRWARLLVLTRGSRGCMVFFEGKKRDVPIDPATGLIPEIDPTGAGDVFAAAFLIRLHRNGGDPWDAGDHANRIASRTVTQSGMDAKIACIRKAIAR